MFVRKNHRIRDLIKLIKDSVAGRPGHSVPSLEGTEGDLAPPPFWNLGVHKRELKEEETIYFYQFPGFQNLTTALWSKSRNNIISFGVLTAMRMLDRLGIQTSSSFVKI